jgi:glucose-6-phosphate 1-dehydrogenase
MAVEQNNPFSIESARPGHSCVMVIFGATGDLTKRLLMPSFYNLKVAGLLPKKFAIVGLSNIDMSTDAFRAEMTKEAPLYATGTFDHSVWEPLVQNLYYMTGDFADAATFNRLKQQLESIDKSLGTPGNYLFYLATAPTFFAKIVEQLGAAELVTQPDGRWRRVIIEKPFGNDLDSAMQLNRQIKKILDEPQIYRIDHYMGKETVQNLMVLRFGNGIFEPIWNRRYIDHVQITAAETVGVENRAGYYETAGALRDMVPNHMFQLLSLVAMEPPNSFDAEAVRDEKSKILHALQPPTPEQVLTAAVRGQYGAGQVLDQPVPAYRSEPGVKPDSNTETYVAIKLGVDNWRWAEVPFYVRTGKRMHARTTELVIRFKRPPFQLFRQTAVDQLAPNSLIIQIQPDEGISLRFGAKIPGPTVHIGDVEMKFKYSEYFGTRSMTGYETLLHDCMIGDPTLFQRDDMTEAGWRVVQPVLDVWHALPARGFPNYEAGSWGPKEADDLLRRDGRIWKNNGEPPSGPAK